MGTRETTIYRLVSTTPGLGLICHLRFLGRKKGRGPYESGPSKTDQKVDPLGGPFASPVMSKSCFQLFANIQI